MVEKIGSIKNPLTIIAIFAAIAEISGTLVLPFISNDNQAIYVWFLIIFPILLIILFFGTLNFNHKVLYAPSDYQNEDNFLQSLPKATLAEKVLKIEAEIAEEKTTELSTTSSQEVKPPSIHNPVQFSNNTSISNQNFFQRSKQTTYLLTEEIIFQKLTKEFNSEIQREVKLGGLSSRYIFDGIVRENGVTTIIEIKFLLNSLGSKKHLISALERIQESVKFLPNEQQKDLHILLVLICEEVNKEKF